MPSQSTLPTDNRTLDSLLSKGENSFGFLRFVLAATVILSHSIPLGGFGREQITSGTSETFGSLAISGFFVVSGFLITASYCSQRSLVRFLWHRALRIFPGFYGCLVITVLLFAPLQCLIETGSLKGYVSEAKQFFVANAYLTIEQYNIGPLLASHPHPRAWIGSLWSLIYEFRCYLLVAMMGFFGVLHLARPLVTLLFCLTLGLHVTESMYPGGVGKIIPLYTDPWMRKLAAYFLVGMIAYLYRNNIYLSPRLALGAGLLIITSLFHYPQVYPIAAIIAVPYILFYLAAILPIQNFDKRADLSYGLYLYGFSVQQLLVTFGFHSFGYWPFAILSIIITIPFAILSFFLIEKPMLRLKRVDPTVLIKAMRKIRSPLV